MLAPKFSKRVGAEAPIASMLTKALHYIVIVNDCQLRGSLFAFRQVSVGTNPALYGVGDNHACSTVKGIFPADVTSGTQHSVA